MQFLGVRVVHFGQLASRAYGKTNRGLSKGGTQRAFQGIMSSQSVSFVYRPMRIGWCMAAGDWVSLRRAVRSCFTMWGGRFNPIIPIEDVETTDDLVRTFRCDTLLGGTAPVEAFIARHPERQNPIRHQPLFSPNEQGRNSAMILDVIHPIARIYEENFKKTPPPEPKLDIYRWDAADPLADVFACEFGVYPPAAETGTDYEAEARNAMMGADKPIALGGVVDAYHPDRITIEGITRAFMKRRAPYQGAWNAPGFYLGEADNFQDIVNFWNLRAAGISLQFHDPRYSARTAPLRDQLLNRIRGGAAPGRPLGVVLYHRADRAENQAEFAPFGAMAGRNPIGHATWNGGNVRVPDATFEEDQALASVDSTAEGVSLTFATPIKPFSQNVFNHRQHYVLSVSPGMLYGNDSATLWTPFLPELNEYYGRNFHFRWDHARAEPDGIGIVRQVFERSLTLKALDVSQLIGEIFKTVGIDAKISKSGQVGITLLQQMGGLHGCRVFKIGGVRKLIEDNRPDRHFDRGTAAETIRAVDTDHALSKYQMIYFQPREHGQELTKDMVLSYLLDRGVFRAGLAFDCPYCRLEFWRSLDEAKSRLECEYCGKAFNAGPQLRDKAWAFRRSGLFGRDDHQEGAIPVLLTILALQEMHFFHTPLFTMAMSLKPITAAIPECETDFVLMGPSSGQGDGIDVVIGECKTRKEITADDVAHLKAVADAFPADKYNVYVVFSRLTPFTPDEIERIKAVNNPHQQRAILLTARELEPWYVYEDTAKEFDIDKSAATFQDMTIATDRVFFRNLRRQPPAAESGAVAE
jgi:hypothetical protein